MSDIGHSSDDGLFVKAKDFIGGTSHHQEDQRPEFTVKEEGGSSSEELYIDDHIDSDLEHQVANVGEGALNADGDNDSEEDYNELFDESSDSDNGSGFRPGRKLPEAEVIRMAISELINLVRNGGIDLNAEYQRDVVWGDERKSGLIKSIMEQFYIPPIIFNVVRRKDPESGETKKVRVCVDGKQRLSSVKAFIDARIGCKDRDGVTWFFKQRTAEDGRPIGRDKNIFSSDDRAAFLKKKLLCYELQKLSRDQEEDLFSRVQLGVQLNNAEKLRASRGPWQTLADEFKTVFSQVVNLSGNKRFSGWLNILACFHQIMEVQQSDPVVPTLKTSGTAIRKMLENADHLTDSLRIEFRRVFTTMANLAATYPDTFKNNKYKRVKTFAPIELVTVAALIHKYKNRTSLELLRGDILYIRKELRHAHRDLRMNSAVWRDAWKLIDELELVRGSADASTVPQPLRTERPGGKKGKKGKKAQPQEDSFSQAEEEEGPQQDEPGLRSLAERIADQRRARRSKAASSATASANTPQVDGSDRNMAVRPGRIVRQAAPSMAANPENVLSATRRAAPRVPLGAPVANMIATATAPSTGNVPPAAHHATAGTPLGAPVANMTGTSSTGRQKRQRINLGGAMPGTPGKRIKVSPKSD